MNSLTSVEILRELRERQNILTMINKILEKLSGNENEFSIVGLSQTKRGRYREIPIFPDLQRESRRRVCKKWKSGGKVFCDKF